jgi:hypothetical protein
VGHDALKFHDINVRFIINIIIHSYPSTSEKEYHQTGVFIDFNSLL